MSYRNKNTTGFGEKIPRSGICFDSFSFPTNSGGQSPEKKHINININPHKNVALSMSTGLALQVLAEAIRELLDVFLFSSHSRGNKTDEDFLIIFHELFILILKLIDDISFVSRRWCPFFGMWRWDMKIHTHIGDERRGGFAFPRSNSACLAWRTKDLQNRNIYCTWSLKIDFLNQNLRNHVRNQEDCWNKHPRLKHVTWVFRFHVERSRLWRDVIHFCGILKSSSCVNVEIIGGIHWEHQRRYIKIRKSFMWAVKNLFSLGYKGVYTTVQICVGIVISHYKDLY